MFIFNLDNSCEIHIIRDDIVYSFLIFGDELITDEYIIDFIGTLEIKSLLEDALTDKINDRDVYMKGLDASYCYEGYNTYSSENLV